MPAKKTAVLLYPYFSNYELSVALSILFQAEKPVTIFGLSTKEAVRSEEGLPVLCDAAMEDLGDPAAHDSLLLTGCMNPFESFMPEKRYAAFVRQFDRPDVVIGAISSAPLLLAQAGMLRERKYLCGVPEEFMEENGMNPANFVKKGPFVQDGNLLTSTGCFFYEFGVQFGRMLNLAFEPGWYRAD